MTGIGTRENNEDVILIEEFNQNSILYLVVDGMGGYQKGEIAAKLVSENIATHLRSVVELNKQAILNAFKKANLSIKQFNDENEIKSGATVGGVLIFDEIAYCFWIGDVKIFYLKKEKLAWESTSHSFINEMFEEDLRKSTEIQKKYGHIVTRSISGKREKSAPDIFEIESFSKGDSFVICSDGVHNVMTLEHLKLLFSEVNGMEKIEEYLAEYAVDNFSLINIF
ncbi:protein serine/threonine phosphatase 2C family protein [Chryseobacterium manosquense]|uniref:Protein serine/threonine phosphatase 2C family protein n=1 Tax=Chryseobacterium manosquense TaxID=2754694 RepID=A0A7H1DTL4_9FLAO|nr:PP2C family protein-serine/threonine phosphatase [Chryseobacterium manosquense]QNS40322.1 protein serine/threonine phosphatase 2C family protein [Chryseobacterium manosquense]